MSEEIKKKVRDTELNLEDLAAVAGGGYYVSVLHCPYCSYNIEFPLTGLYDTEDLIRMHIKKYHDIDVSELPDELYEEPRYIP